ncbi:MAG: hypothetical protein PHZ24_11565 [Bacteroidales bacterium]|nr:hypothetical protein [Bacteroidales bacterium]
MGSEELGVRSWEWGVGSVELGEWSWELGVRSAECGVRSVECGVWSWEFRLCIADKKSNPISASKLEAM